MIFPVRCFTCNKVIGNKWYTYKKLLEKVDDENQDFSIDDVFKQLCVSKFCCKRHFTTHIEVIDDLLLYEDSLPKSITLNTTTSRKRVYECK